MNLVILIGRVGKMGADALRYTPSGKALIEFSLATNEGYGDKQTTTWHNIVAWEKLAENVGKHVEVGQQIAVEGRIQVQSWEASDGTKRYKTQIVAWKIEFLAKSGGARRSATSDGGEQGDDNASRDVDPDDIPW